MSSSILGDLREKLFINIVADQYVKKTHLPLSPYILIIELNFLLDNTVTDKMFVIYIGRIKNIFFLNKHDIVRC